MKHYDVHVVYADGTQETFMGVHYVTQDEHALHLNRKKYAGLVNDREMKHVASLPFTALRRWTVEETE